MTARRFLIVEDEPLIAMVLEDFLGVLGAQVAATADSVAEALARVAQGGIDAAILDVNLAGGEKSWPVAAALAQAGIDFAFASGGGEGEIALAHRNRAVLAKPFTLADVERTLARLAV